MCTGRPSAEGLQRDPGAQPSLRTFTNTEGTVNTIVALSDMFFMTHLFTLSIVACLLSLFHVAHIGRNGEIIVGSVLTRQGPVA